MNMRVCLCVATVATLNMSAYADLTRPDLEALAETLESARETLESPGMSVAIIKDGEVVFAEGFGERTLGEGDAVDAETIFAIGSSSKAFTSAAVAMLVDEGDVRWGDRVNEHLPWFRMHDAYPTDELRIHDMLSHTSGLPRGDLLWYGSGVERKKIVEALPELEPVSSFRSQFGYQNIMYLAAGLMIEEITGDTWDDFITARFFEPLGMDDSSTSITALSDQDNIASPHAKLEGEMQAVPWRNIDNAAPAGSINSNVTDMAKWVALLLNEGRLGEGEDVEQLITKGSIDVMWSPMSIATPVGPGGALRAESHFLLYGLGWFLQDYRGERVVQHGGNIDGMSALVAMMPEHELGVVVLTNLNGTPLTTVAVNEIFDAYLGFDDHDWAAEASEIMQTVETMQAQAIKQAEADRIEGTTPSLALADYAGTYEHDYYGTIEITLDDDRLVSTRGDLVGDLSHWHFDTFEVEGRAPLPQMGNFTFIIGGDGKVRELVALGIDEWMKKSAEPTADESIELTEEDMRRYVGTYLHEAFGIEVNVFIADGTLRSQLPGQPSFELLPTGVHQFAVGGLPAQVTVDIVFALNDDGAVESLTLTQTPGGTFELLPQSD